MITHAERARAQRQERSARPGRRRAGAHLAELGAAAVARAAAAGRLVRASLLLLLLLAALLRAGQPAHARPPRPRLVLLRLLLFPVTLTVLVRSPAAAGPRPCWPPRRRRARPCAASCRGRRRARGRCRRLASPPRSCALTRDLRTPRRPRRLCACSAASRWPVERSLLIALTAPAFLAVGTARRRRASRAILTKRCRHAAVLQRLARMLAVLHRQTWSCLIASTITDSSSMEACSQVNRPVVQPGEQTECATCVTHDVEHVQRTVSFRR